MTETSLSLGAALALAGCFLATAAAFLLTGWRLGRESAGRAMFEFPLAAPQDRDAGTLEPDPWDEAMRGGPRPDPASADARTAGGGVGSGVHFLYGGGREPG